MDDWRFFVRIFLLTLLVGYAILGAAALGIWMAM